MSPWKRMLGTLGQLASTGMEQNIVLSDLECCVQFINKALEPVDPLVLDKMNHVARILKRHHRKTVEECEELEQQLADELQKNSDNLRTLAALKHEEDKFKNKIEKGHKMMNKLRQRQDLHQQVVKETENLQKDVDQQQQFILQLKHEIRFLRKKMLPLGIHRAPIIHKCVAQRQVNH